MIYDGESMIQDRLSLRTNVPRDCIFSDGKMFVLYSFGGGFFLSSVTERANKNVYVCGETAAAQQCFERLPFFWRTPPAGDFHLMTPIDQPEKAPCNKARNSLKRSFQPLPSMCGGIAPRVTCDSPMACNRCLRFNGVEEVFSCRGENTAIFLGRLHALHRKCSLGK